MPGLVCSDLIEAPVCDLVGQQLYISSTGALGVGRRVASVISSTPGQFIWFDPRCAGPIFTGAPVVEVSTPLLPTLAKTQESYGCTGRPPALKVSLMLDLNQLSL